MCYIVNPFTQQLMKVRALFDSGSNVSLLKRETARKLNLNGVPSVLSMNTAGNMMSISEETDVTFHLMSLDHSFLSCPILATTVQDIGEPLQPIPTNPKQHGHLKDLLFTEKYPGTFKRPFQVLVAEPFYSQLMEKEQRVSRNLAVPSAKLSKLGWILRGATGLEPIRRSSVFLTQEGDHMTYDLERMYKEGTENFDFGKFWSGENVGISPHEPDDKVLSAMDFQAEEHMKNTAVYDDKQKCWYVELPWKDPTPESRQLSDNYGRAVAMWRKVLTTVKQEHIDLVDQSYKEFIDNGFAEKVALGQETPMSHPTYVMTSRPVIRPEKASTKCRIVINASMPDKRNKKYTLNNLLLPGRNMLPQITKLILNSKVNQFIATIDIRKMFLSVRLKKESDMDMLRFVWGKPGQVKPEMFRFTRLPFGCVCSPYLAIWCLQQTAKKWQKIYPKASEIILSKTYMDDILVGGDSELEIAKLVQEILVILESGGFYGHKIAANSKKVLNSIDKERIDPADIISILGLKLDQTTDEYMFDLDSKFQRFDPNAEKITRRDIVSLASQVFDTQGYVSPFVMKFKQIIPMLWQNKTTWDENLFHKTITNEEGERIADPVAKEAVQLFKDWIYQIPRLKEMRFQRWTGGPIKFIAVFGDASKKGMGVVAYIVSEVSRGKLQSQLAFSKTSIMPKNLRKGAQVADALTIARAELIALLMAVNVGLYLQDAYKEYITNKDMVYFTDSLLNLQRVQRGKGHCKVWEERRIVKILDNTQVSQVRFCPGILNPADLPSRGLSLDELKEKEDLWAKGPDFLVQPEEKWPRQPIISTDESSSYTTPLESTKDLEVYFMQVKAEKIQEVELTRAQIFTVNGGIISQENPIHFLDKLVLNMSNWFKILKTLIYVKRFCQKGKVASWMRAKNSRSILDSFITSREIEWAELMLIRRAQVKHLSQEINVLKKGKLDHNNKLPKNSTLKHLPVYWDNQKEVIRIESRLHLSSTLSHDYTNPIIVPKDLIAERKILHLHQSRLHMSQKQTFNLLREKYWVLGNFKYVKSVVSKCKTPRCRYVKYESPKMSPLPAMRIDNPVPWSKVGVDYLGPLCCKHDCLEEVSSLVHSEQRFAKLSRHEKQRKIEELSEKCIHPKSRKVWLALFTCLHARAIHVEVARSCSTLSFLEAFRRFVGLCGRPLKFYSDNAQNFKKANKHFQELFKSVNFERIQAEKYNGDAPIEWEFSKPEAPWTNGVTERMVGIFKRQFRIALQRDKVTIRELETLIIELTSIINDRPLGITNQDPTAWTAVTPNLLIHGRQKGQVATPEESILSTLPYGDMWIARKRFLNKFWLRWRQEYLQELSLSKKWSEPNISYVKVGDVVILKPDTMEKNSWNLARIIQVHKNQDNVVASVTLCLPNGQKVIRSIRQIALLESDVEEVEMKESESAYQSGCAGNLEQTLTAPGEIGQSPQVCQSPARGGPCHGEKVDEENFIPEDVATMSMKSVPQTMNDLVSQDAPTNHSHKLRKKRRRRGSYLKMLKGNQ